MVEEDFIKKLIESDENVRFDRKLKITSKQKIAKTISAFSNTEGGIILIGVSDEKKIIGIDPEEEKYMINSANELFCSPPAKIRFDEFTKTEHNDLTKTEKEICLLLVAVERSHDEKIYVKNEAGEKKAYHRVQDQTLMID